jgi:hypothetical protein
VGHPDLAVKGNIFRDRASFGLHERGRSRLHYLSPSTR